MLGFGGAGRAILSFLLRDFKKKHQIQIFNRSPVNLKDAKKGDVSICSLNEIHKTTPILIPLHPRTKLKIKELGIKLNVNIIEPVGYFDMMELLKKCELVLTDSGGLQKEAYFFKKNCVTMRNETEWVELIENKVNIIVGSEKDKIVSGVKKMLKQQSDFTIDLYGNGNACKVITSEITTK